MNNNVLKILNSITKIEPIIHQVKFFCPIPSDKFPFSADDFDDEMNSHQVRKKSKKFKEGFFWPVCTNIIEVRYNRIKGRRGFFLIMSNPTPFILLTLLDKFKMLQLSSVEYTIDLFCSNPDEVRDLYFLFKKYMIFKRKKNNYFKIYCDEESNLNYSFYIDERLKIYERANDNLRQNEAWKFDDLDRLRLEFTSNKYYLNKVIKTGSFDDFIDNCKFESFIFYLFFKRLFFMKFKQPNKKHLPKETELYKIGKEKQNHNCIMYYKLKKNISFNYLTESNEFKQLINKIIDQVKAFNEEWESEAIDYRKIMYMDRKNGLIKIHKYPYNNG